MAYADQQMSGSRVVSIVIVALIHIAIGYALITGLAYKAAQKVIERVTTVDVDEPPPPEEPDEPPPPQEVPDTPPPPVAPPPPISIAPAPPPIRTQTTIPPPAPPAVLIPPPAAPAPPPAPPAPSQARRVSPKNQASWTRRIIQNYPSRAIREELEGTVSLSVSIGPDGRVTGCSVTGSSGHSVLDDAACKDYTRYARFDPALNDAGNPISSSYSQSIRYTLN